MARAAEVADAVRLDDDEDAALGIATTNDLMSLAEVIGGGNTKSNLFIIVKVDSIGDLGISGHGSTFLLIEFENVNFPTFCAHFSMVLQYQKPEYLFLHYILICYR